MTGNWRYWKRLLHGLRMRQKEGIVHLEREPRSFSLGTVLSTFMSG